MSSSKELGRSPRPETVPVQSCWLIQTTSPLLGCFNHSLYTLSFKAFSDSQLPANNFTFPAMAWPAGAALPNCPARLLAVSYVKLFLPQALCMDVP